MDYTALALSALTVVSSAIGSEIGKDIWELIKSPFKSDRDKKLVQEFEKNPNDVEKQAVMKYELSGKLEDDKSLAVQLAELLKTSNAQIHITNINNTHGGKGDIVNGDKYGK